MFVTVLSIILVAACSTSSSSLIMLVRAKTRDIAILRTMGATRGGLMRIFMTVGTTIGALGTVAGLVLGFVFLYLPPAVVDFVHRAGHRPESVGPVDPLPHRIAVEDRSGRDRRRSCVMALMLQLPRDALSGVEGGEHRSGAGAAL